MNTPKLPALNNPNPEELEMMRKNNAVGQASSDYWNWKHNQDMRAVGPALSQQIHLNRFFSK